MGKVIAFVALLFAGGCADRALPWEGGDDAATRPAIDLGPCGGPGERCCAPSEAALLCEILTPVLGCDGANVCTLCRPGSDGRCIE